MKKIFVTGTFDLYHAGHARFLKYARRHGDRLYVGVNGDVRVHEKKGRIRPIYPLQQRLEILYDNQNITDIRPIEYDPVRDHGTSARGIRNLLTLWAPDIWIDGAHRSAEKHAVPFSKEFGFEYVVINTELIHTTQIIDKIVRLSKEPEDGNAFGS